MTEAPEPGGVNWVLEDLAAKADHIRQAVVLSPDGLTLGSSPGLSKEDADHLAALAAAVHSLARGAGRRFQGGQSVRRSSRWTARCCSSARPTRVCAWPC